FDFYNADREPQGSSEPQEFTAGTSWDRFPHTVTVPAGVSAVVMRLTFGTYSTAIRLAAPMIEEGGNATKWEQGKAVAMVLVDQLQTSSPLFPLTDCSLTLLEAYMQTHGGEAATAAIESRERQFSVRLTVDFERNGEAVDVSDLVDNISTDRMMKGSAPEEIMLVEGSSAAELKFDLSG